MTLESVDAKIRRAKWHREWLRTSIQTVIPKTPPPERFTYEYPEGTAQVLVRVHNPPAIDPDWALIVGDCLTNLRAALDHLAWQLVLRFGEGPPNKHTFFPIYESRLNEKGNPRTVTITPGLDSPDVLRLLESVQPFNSSVPDEDNLRALSRLVNIDKHRLLLTHICTLDPDNMWWGSNGGGNGLESLFVGRLHDGTVVARFDFKDEGIPPGFDCHPNLQVVIDENDDTRHLAYFDVIAVLESLIWKVQWTVSRFRNDFPVLDAE